MLAYIFDGPRKSLLHRKPTFTDYWSGNVSMSRETYFRTGGYSEVFARIGYGKDVDFGRRLVAGGVALHLAPEALTIHHFSESFADRLGKAHRTGLAWSYLKETHPECPVDEALLVRGSWSSATVVWLCRILAAILEPFDRGAGVPMTPLAFVYDLGLRTATARGVSTFYRRRSKAPSGA
jgi:GT2 family glycosyltransferase